MKNYRFIKTRINNWSIYSTYEVTDENGNHLGYHFSRYGKDDLSESVLKAREENEKKLSVNRKGTVDYEKKKFKKVHFSLDTDLTKWYNR